jgi:hypothetical protein
MKKLRSVIASFFLFLIAIGCQQEETIQKGKLEFSFSASSLSNNGRKSSESVLRYVVVTVIDESNNKIYNRKKIELFSFGDNYLSEPIEFIPGTYSLTEFFVLDENTILYATPTKNSNLAHLVADPLPINFGISKDETTKVTPEVIAVDEFTALDFGYTTFSFNIIETVSFHLAVFAYSEITENFELTSSHVSVNSGNNELFDQNLVNVTTRVIVKDTDDLYHVQITKEGYEPYDGYFSKDSLLSFTEDAALKIILTGSIVDLTTGLVGHYPFTGDANDQSGNQLNGTVFGASLTTDRKGNPNSAYSFNGINNYISIQDNDILDFEAGQDFSISVWVSVKFPQAIPSTGIYDIIRKWDGMVNNGYAYSISYLNENAAFGFNTFFNVRYDGSSCGHGPQQTSTAINSDAWHHIVMVKKAGTLYQYLDGAMVSAVADNTVCTTKNNVHITIGCRGQLARFYTGKIDDIRFYNRSVDASEIHALFTE